MSFVLDTPQQIESFRLLATLRGLELEIKLWNAYGSVQGPTRGMALASAKRILRQYERPAVRTRKQAQVAMVELLMELGLISD
jgi:hypothetical protein